MDTFGGQDRKPSAIRADHTRVDHQRGDELAVVLRLPVRPSAESLVEVHAEAIVRASARRWAHAVPAFPPAPVGGSSRARLRLAVAAALGALVVLAIVLVPTVLDRGAPPAPATVRQHAPGDTTAWDPWQDPMRFVPAG